MKYLVDINGARFEVELDGDFVRVNGGPRRRATFAEVAGTPVGLVAIGDSTPEVHRVIGRRDGPPGNYTLRIEGRRYKVEAMDERARAIRDLSTAALTTQGPRPLLAPMPGLVVRVEVAVGDRVEAGQSIVVMEAMKMENELRAPAAGTVKTVTAAVGAAVEKGAILVEFA
jgi:biotin carboxyl carrier protein